MMPIASLHHVHRTPRSISALRRSLESASSRWGQCKSSLRCGYDFEFRRGDEHLLVEVKGIKGSRLEFNMTAKEWGRARLHPSFVVVAVTKVLDQSFDVYVLGQEDLFRMRRRPMQYRLSIAPTAPRTVN